MVLKGFVPPDMNFVVFAGRGAAKKKKKITMSSEGVKDHNEIMVTRGVYLY
jgi:hypothetical protein